MVVDIFVHRDEVTAGNEKQGQFVREVLLCWWPSHSFAGSSAAKVEFIHIPEDLLGMQSFLRARRRLLNILRLYVSMYAFY